MLLLMNTQTYFGLVPLVIRVATTASLSFTILFNFVISQTRTSSSISSCIISPKFPNKDSSLLNQHFNKCMYHCSIFVHHLASLDYCSNFLQTNYAQESYWFIYFGGHRASTCFSTQLLTVIIQAPS